MEMKLNKQNKKKHHFLPEVYLKGFTQSDSNELYVLNKEWGNISSKHPAQVMYDLHLYTLEGYDNPLIIEDFYSEVESELAGAFELIEKLRHDPNMYRSLKENLDFHKLMKILVAFQFWRAPAQDELARKYAENLYELYLNLPEYTKSTIEFDEGFIKYLYVNRHVEANLKLIQNMVLPVVTFQIYDDSYIDFYFYVSQTVEGLVLTCDNPILFENESSLFNFRNFMFPLSKNVIMGSGSKDSGFLIGDFNTVIYEQASTHIVGASKDMLREFSVKRGN